MNVSSSFKRSDYIVSPILIAYGEVIKSLIKYRGK